MDNHLPLSQLCAMVGEAMALELDDSYWVCAEIASISERGGHAYLDLIEKSEKGILAAKMRATCWSNVWGMLRPYFEQETGSCLQVGMQVLVEVMVDFHAVYGLSATIINIDPSYTIGDLAKQRQQTITRLQSEGVIDLNKQCLVPTIVRRIAVISSEKAAGYEDFQNQLSQGGFAFSTTLFPATMQGERAAASIISALDTIAQEEEEWDAVVIIRGGGATTDLSCFDDYDLCNHCAQFPLPIVTGIGHTKDISILDMVAFMALKTPTAVAQWFVEGRVNELQRLTDWRRRLRQTAERQILIRRHRIELLAQTIQLYSPQRIFQKGYSLTLCNGKVLRHAQDVKSGDEVVVKLEQGELHYVN